MEPSVQGQLRDGYASLVQKQRDSGTPKGHLGTAYGELGNLLLASGQLDAAESCYLNAQALAPGEARWPYYLGHVYKTKGELGKSVGAFERALQLQPADIATLVWLGNAYLDQGRTEASEPLFMKALSVDTRLAAARIGLGRAALARRSYAEAVDQFEQALALDQRASIVRYPLALAYRGLGDRNKAEAHLRQRGDVDVGPPDPLMQQLGTLLRSAVAYENRGVRALDRGQWAEAAAYFRKGLELAPDNASLHHHLGTALAVTGDPRGAFDQFQQAVRLSPTFAKAHYSLGLLMASSDRGRERALGEFSAAVRYDPSYVEARLQLADALRRSGRADASLLQYEEVIRTDPRMAEAQVGHAMALARLNRYQEARTRLTEGVQTNPERRPVLSRALVRLLAAAPDDRVRDGQRAIALAQELLKEPRTPDISETMAMASAEVGQYDEAARWQRDAIAAAEKAGWPDIARRMQENLTLYERHQPCRTPWRADE